MKRLSGMLCALCALTSLASAQERRPAAPMPAPDQAHAPVFESGVSLGQLTPTPEMWFYEQERMRHADPKEAVRRKAEFVAAQRRARIAARQWSGNSAMRPAVTLTPIIGHGPAIWRRDASQYLYVPPPRVAQPIVVSPATRY